MTLQGLYVNRDIAVRPFWYCAVGLLLGAAGIAVYTELPLSWDGSYIFYRMLSDRQLYAAAHRYAALLPMIPAWLAMHLTERITIIRPLFDFGYSILPSITFALCVLLTSEKKRWLLIWPAFGITFGTGISQTFYIYEGLIACQLAWPILMGLTDDSEKQGWKSLLIFLLGLVVFWSHPAAALILGLLGGAAFSTGRQNRIYGTILFAGAIFRRFIPLDPYETTQTSLSTFMHDLSYPVGHWALLALFCGILLAMTYAISPKNWRKSHVIVQAFFWISATTAFAVWSAVPSNRLYALGARHLIFFSSAIFYILAIIDFRMHNSAITPQLANKRRNATLGLIFLHALLIAAFGSDFRVEIRKTGDDLSHRTTSCVPTEALLSISGGRSTLDHWSITYFGLVHGNERQPGRIMLSQSDCEALKAVGRMPVLPFDHSRVAGMPHWFDFSRLERSAKL